MPDQPTVESAQEMKPLGSTISTDRLCASCNFNLFGQLVHREPHYGLVVARCPECGTIASLQEYPAMTKWIGRWKLLLVGAWIGLLLIVAMIQAGVVSGFTHSSITTASGEYADRLNDEFQRSFNTENSQNYGRGWIDNGWAKANAPRILDEMGGVLKATNPYILWGWVPPALIAGGFGIFWSVTLLGARRRTVLLVNTIPIALGFFFLVQSSTTTRIFVTGQMVWTEYIAHEPFQMPVALATIFVMFLAISAGVFIGRPFARFMICLMLPPRLRAPLGILWTRDGLTPPKPRSY